MEEPTHLETFKKLFFPNDLSFCMKNSTPEEIRRKHGYNYLRKTQTSTPQNAILDPGEEIVTLIIFYFFN